MSIFDGGEESKHAQLDMDGTTDSFELIEGAIKFICFEKRQCLDDENKKDEINEAMKNAINMAFISIHAGMKDTIILISSALAQAGIRADEGQVKKAIEFIANGH